ncbi:hypothetical protein G3I44_14225 [Halogeometricum borinquense]|uniref:Uncharacterized protein n=1 Tax=Halogeometricum borinquense TaxID=60847 RepID=A0A6C0UIL6_9EURY|nr:hypothetical protein [Halogeometricum borinquense]QIB75342.1 hypothetical protein G3I44_14225 [Halogeometricum borinquense]
MKELYLTTANGLCHVEIDREQYDKARREENTIISENKGEPIYYREDLDVDDFGQGRDISLALRSDDSKVVVEEQGFYGDWRVCSGTYFHPYFDARPGIGVDEPVSPYFEIAADLWEHPSPFFHEQVLMQLLPHDGYEPHIRRAEYLDLIEADDDLISELDDQLRAVVQEYDGYRLPEALTEEAGGPDG